MKKRIFVVTFIFISAILRGENEICLLVNTNDCISCTYSLQNNILPLIESQATIYFINNPNVTDLNFFYDRLPELKKLQIHEKQINNVNKIVQSTSLSVLVDDKIVYVKRVALIENYNSIIKECEKYFKENYVKYTKELPLSSDCDIELYNNKVFLLDHAANLIYTLENFDTLRKFEIPNLKELYDRIQLSAQYEIYLEAKPFLKMKLIEIQFCDIKTVNDKLFITLVIPEIIIEGKQLKISKFNLLLEVDSNMQIVSYKNVIIPQNKKYKNYDLEFLCPKLLDGHNYIIPIFKYENFNKNDFFMGSFKAVDNTLVMTSFKDIKYPFGFRSSIHNYNFNTFYWGNNYYIFQYYPYLLNKNTSDTTSIGLKENIFPISSNNLPTVNIMCLGDSQNSTMVFLTEEGNNYIYTIKSNKTINKEIIFESDILKGVFSNSKLYALKSNGQIIQIDLKI